MNNNISENRVNIENAKLLKEKGFDNCDCYAYYHIDIGYKEGYSFCYSNVYKQTDGLLLCPTTALAIAWIRENFAFHISTDFDSKHWFEVITQLSNTNRDIRGEHNKPEEAENAAIHYTLTKLI